MTDLTPFGAAVAATLTANRAGPRGLEPRSLYELAQAAGVNRGTIWGALRGLRPLSAELETAIRDALPGLETP